MKKFMILMLSLAVLFSFAACDNSGSSTASGVISSALVSGGNEKVYIPGDTLDLNDYEFKLVMADGSEQDANASDFIAVDTLVIPSAATKDSTVKVAYKGMAATTVELPFNLGTVSKITLSGEATTKEYFAAIDKADGEYTDDLLSIAGLTVTASYTDENGVKDEKEVTNDDFLTPSIADDDWDASKISANTKKNMTITYGSFTSPITATYEVTLKPNLVQSVALKATTDYTVYAGSQEKKLALAAFNADGSVKTAGVYVELTYQNGETATESTAVKFGVAENTIATEVANIGDLTPAKAEATTLYAYYSGKKVVEKLERTVKLDLNVVANAEKSLTVALVSTAEANFKEEGTALKDYTNDLAGFKKLLEVKIKYADGSVAIDALADDAYDIVTPASDARDLTGLVAGDRITVSVTASRSGDVTLSGSGDLVVGAK